MKLTEEIKQYVNGSVLCWLATSSAENIPNVSPKEIFTTYRTDEIIIANIASPQTVKNISQNENVCISFIDILRQKGYQLKGTARIIDPKHEQYNDMKQQLVTLTEGLFPFPTITSIYIEKAKPILAPRYLLFPETTEAQQIENARKTYGI